jgi:intergrase/recombinase
MTTLTDTQIKARRDAIIIEMQSIREMIRGKISFQTFKRTKADGSVQERGPYTIFQRWLNNKNHSERIPKDELPALTRAVDGYQSFQKLAAEFAELTELLTERHGTLLPSKKNSANQSKAKNTKKPNSSSKPRSRKSPPARPAS